MSEHSWTVRVDLLHPAGLAEIDADAWLTNLAGYAPAVGLDDGVPRERVSVTITVPTASLRNASRDALRMVEAVTGSKAVGIEVLTTAEFDRRLNEPQIPPLIGQVEMAQRLGVSRQRVAQLARERRDFPPEVARTAAGPLYIEAQFVTWSQQDRRPGRPRRPPMPGTVDWPALATRVNAKE